MDRNMEVRYGETYHFHSLVLLLTYIFSFSTREIYKCQMVGRSKSLPSQIIIAMTNGVSIGSSYEYLTIETQVSSQPGWYVLRT